MKYTLMLAAVALTLSACSNITAPGVLSSRSTLNNRNIGRAEAHILETNGTERHYILEGYKSDQTKLLESLDKMSDTLKAFAPKP